jgi:hypothetical protein
MSDVSRDIGKLEEAVGTLKVEVHAMRGDLTEIKEAMREARGGIRMLISVGAVGGAIGAAIVKVWANLKGA